MIFRSNTSSDLAHNSCWSQRELHAWEEHVRFSAVASLLLLIHPWVMSLLTVAIPWKTIYSCPKHSDLHYKLWRDSHIIRSKPHLSMSWPLHISPCSLCIFRKHPVCQKFQLMISCASLSSSVYRWWKTDKENSQPAKLIYLKKRNKSNAKKKESKKEK